jgi:hypothetical protein
MLKCLFLPFQSFRYACDLSLETEGFWYIFSVMTIVYIPIVFMNSLMITTLHLRSTRFNIQKHVVQTILVSAIIFCLLSFIVPKILFLITS